MIAPDDLAACRAAIRQGSRSFHAASKLLPSRVRDPALALYAFCRIADDAVDEGSAKADAVASLADRLDAVYRGAPRDAFADRAFAAVVADTGLPRALPEALLEGLAWDAAGRRYDTLGELHAYCARVAASVGAMMCVLMGVRDADALARACDLGLAMQLTNIARDIGEDAAMGRVFLPLDWVRAAGLDPDGLAPGSALAGLTKRLLGEATRLYHRAEAGIACLPLGCRPGIYAARHIYAAIGSEIARAGHDSMTRRARTGAATKLALLALSVGRAGLTTVTPRSAVSHADPAPAVRFLVEAASKPRHRGAWGEGRAGAVVSVMASLAARDRLPGLIGGSGGPISMG